MREPLSNEKREELRGIVADVLGIERSRLIEEAGPTTIETWDSLAHLTIVTAIEQCFGIQFGMEEIRKIDSFGALEKALLAHLAA